MGWVNNNLQKFKKGGRVLKVSSKARRDVSESGKKASDSYSRKTDYEGTMGKGTRTVEEKDGKYKETFTKTKGEKHISEKVLRKGKKRITILEKDGKKSAYKNGRKMRVKKAERKWNK